MNDVTEMNYTAVYQKRDGHDGSIDFDEPGWLAKVDVRNVAIFSLQPKPGSGLPNISVHLTPLPDGTLRELVFFTRPHGRLAINSGKQTTYFRMYCVGWKARIADRDLASVFWIYPSGSIVAMAGERAEETYPPYMNELIEHYATKDLPRASVSA